MPVSGTDRVTFQLMGVRRGQGSKGFIEAQLTRCHGLIGQACIFLISY